MDTQQIEFLVTLEDVIRKRIDEPAPDSYTSKLIAAGTKRMAQKVGEEGVELALAVVDGADQDVLDEAADLIYHMLVVLNSRGLRIADVAGVLESRHA